MTKQIEFACIGNRGRSPVAEIIGRNHLRKAGALGNYDTCSSGILVNEIKNGAPPTAKAIAPYVRMGLERDDVYSEVGSLGVEHLLKRVESGEELGHTELDALAKLYGMAMDTFGREEVEHRAEALRHFGIEGKVKETQDQTIIRPEAIAIFGMDKIVVDGVREIYSGSGYNPVIDVLGKVATGDMGVALPNAFGKGKQEYFRCVEALLEQVPKVMDTALRL